MKIGLFGIGSGICANPQVAAEVAQHAEASGLDSRWTGEHVVLPEPRQAPSPADPEFAMLHPSTILAYIAGVTRSIRLGTGIVLIAQRNPVVLAGAVRPEPGPNYRPAAVRAALGLGRRRQRGCCKQQQRRRQRRRERRGRGWHRAGDGVVAPAAERDGGGRRCLRRLLPCRLHQRRRGTGHGVARHQSRFRLPELSLRRYAQRRPRRRALGTAGADRRGHDGRVGTHPPARAV